jgi:hypothetical protein
MPRIIAPSKFNGGMIAAAVLGATFGLILLAFIAYLLVRLRKTRLARQEHVFRLGTLHARTTSLPRDLNIPSKSYALDL